MATPPNDFTQRIGFVKFANAQYDMTIDPCVPSASVESTIELTLTNTNGTGLTARPIVDFAHPELIRSIHLRPAAGGDEHEVGWDRVSSSDGAARYMVLAEEIAAGVPMRVRVVHDLDLTRNAAGDDGSLVFFRMSHAKHFSMKGMGRDHDRLFLERYLPANLEFDQHPMQINVELDHMPRNMMLFTNGDAVLTGSHRPATDARDELLGNRFTIDFPATYTASSVFFFLGRSNAVTRRVIAAPPAMAGAAEPWPKVILFGERGVMRTKARHIIDQVQEHLPGIMHKLGPYPHARPLLLCAGSHGIEYVGAAEVSTGNVAHELVHQYVGRCLMPKDGNAGWIDEAVAHWIESGCQKYPVEPDAHGARLGAGSSYRRATDLRSRTLGPMVLGHIDWLLSTAGNGSGGPKSLIDVLKRYVQGHRMSLIDSKDFQKQIERGQAPSVVSKIERIFKLYIY